LTYLVTGGAGFIGSALVHALVERGERVRVLDNLATGHKSNLSDVMSAIEFVEADICDLPSVEQAMNGVDYVLHQAALPSVPRSVEDPLLSHRVNSDGTINVLWAAKQAGVKRLVYAASSSAYGDTAVLPKVENMLPNPLSPYAVNKLMGEYYNKAFYRCYGLETVSLRYFNIFGPRQDPTSAYSGVLSLFITKLLNGETPSIFGDGEQSRDFTFVANAVQANLLACTATAAPGNLYNVGTGSRITLNETLQMLAKILGVEANPQYGPTRAGDVRDSQADITAARRDLGYDPKVGFEEGLRQTVDWYRSTVGAAAA
jgi:UDP-glucose 4-epimerase